MDLIFFFFKLGYLPVAGVFTADVVTVTAELAGAVVDTLTP